ncbi:MAG TPA: hypothetical protein PK360_08125 [bacterium]|nr:hypothetical protein [bacterium]
MKSGWYAGVNDILEGLVFQITGQNDILGLVPDPFLGFKKYSGGIDFDLGFDQAHEIGPAKKPLMIEYLKLLIQSAPGFVRIQLDAKINRGTVITRLDYPGRPRDDPRSTECIDGIQINIKHFGQADSGMADFTRDQGAQIQAGIEHLNLGRFDGLQGYGDYIGRFVLIVVKNDGFRAQTGQHSRVHFRVDLNGILG